LSKYYTPGFETETLAEWKLILHTNGSGGWLANCRQPRPNFQIAFDKAGGKLPGAVGSGQLVDH